MIVIFSLVANRENRDRVTIIYLEQSDIASVSERDYEFAEKWIGFLGPSTGKRKLLEQRPRALNDFQRSFCGTKIMICQKVIQSFEL